MLKIQDLIRKPKSDLTLFSVRLSPETIHRIDRVTGRVGAVKQTIVEKILDLGLTALEKRIEQWKK